MTTNLVRFFYDILASTSKQVANKLEEPFMGAICMGVKFSAERRQVESASKIRRKIRRLVQDSFAHVMSTAIVHDYDGSYSLNAMNRTVSWVLVY